MKRLLLLFISLAVSSVSLKLRPLIRRRRHASFQKRFYRDNSDLDQPQQSLEAPPLSKREDDALLRNANAPPTNDKLLHDKVDLKAPIKCAHELRRRVLDEGVELKKLQVLVDTATTPNLSQLLDHNVVQLLAERYRTNSTPGHRSDNATLALSIEGGGMRGAVSAGMASAIACLGLIDSFDVIYGSSAGSVIGAYMVSRQMCMDVYVDILPAAKRTFVCVKRMLSAIAGNAIDLVLYRGSPKYGLASPGMNISFVLDGIMHENEGLRPIDIERFEKNDKLQPLRIASSYVQDGKLKTRCFGTEEFFPVGDDVMQRSDGLRHGLFASLESSMAVPGATGPPVPIVVKNETLSFFDAFCFEPIPYRSAVEDGATHVLVLASRPEGFQPKTKPGVYELGVAPIYFRSHGEKEVARFFERGGQQYIYAEDLLTLEEGKRSKEAVTVPPPRVLYGVDPDTETQRCASNRENWKKAHLLPLKVPQGTPELATLEQDRDEVLKAVRGGFAVAFDLLAPAIGLEIDDDLTGFDVARVIFPKGSLHNETEILAKQISFEGDEIQVFEPALVEAATTAKPRRTQARNVVVRLVNLLRRKKEENTTLPLSVALDTPDDAIQQLLAGLPGLQDGKLKHFARSIEASRLDRDSV
ncbi:hypothetical protein MPSEU_000604900 [Mayamaea pseudoterrestris]|nr:hypothetical protein MPSEU_000604900 [Mayamaea pseudoterrestris]